MASGPVLRMLARTESPRRPKLTEMIRAYLALRYREALSPAECAAFARGVYDGQREWTPNFDGIQFTLGRAWYTHLESDRVDEYFENASRSDAIVSRYAPGLREKMLGFVRGLVGGTVVQRAGWCGPGVHIFPANTWVAEKGGDVHYDTEGLSEPQLEARVPAFTFILMLQAAESGGGLRVWDRVYDGPGDPERPDATTRSAIIDYEPGELVVIDSYRLHQIMPFTGDTDRISATVHTALAGDHWEAWF